MPRPKGSKNKPKTTGNTTTVSTTDYTAILHQKMDEKAQIETEIATITTSLEDLKNQLKDKKKAFSVLEKEIVKIEAKKTAEEAKAAEEAKKAQLESVLEKLIGSGMSTDEILEKLK